MAPWATSALVQQYTGVTVDDALLTQAQGVIDLYSGVTVEDASRIGSRDTNLLAQATAYQAAWLSTQLDAFSRTDVSRVNQDGLSAEFAHEGLTLAPLAQRCLARLSWLKSRSISIQPGLVHSLGSVESYQAAWLRDTEPVRLWRQGWV